MEELATVIQTLDGNPTKEEVQDMISEVDVEGNRTIDFEDFLNIMATKMKVIRLERLVKFSFSLFWMLAVLIVFWKLIIMQT